MRMIESDFLLYCEHSAINDDKGHNALWRQLVPNSILKLPQLVSQGSNEQ
jgi:hypothetical protein